MLLIKVINVLYVIKFSNTSEELENRHGISHLKGNTSGLCLPKRIHQ